MLLKLIGSLMIIGASSFIGYALAKDLKTRQQELRQFQGQISMLENEIRYMSNPLADAFEKIAEGKSGSSSVIFLKAAEIMKNEAGSSAPDAWKRAVEACISHTSLNKEDEKIIKSFANMLGGSDTEGQLKNIRNFTGMLENQQKNADEKYKSTAPVYRKLGVLFGIAIVILLL